MSEIIRPNGRTLRRFCLDGLLISEVEFRIDDLGGVLVLGYMVGPDDGRSSLYPTAAEAVANYRATPEPRAR